MLWNVFFEGEILIRIFWVSNFNVRLCFEMYFLREPFWDVSLEGAILMFWNVFFEGAILMFLNVFFEGAIYLEFRAVK